MNGSNRKFDDFLKDFQNTQKTKMARRVPATAAVVVLCIVLSTASASSDVAASHGRGRHTGAEALRYDNPEVFALAVGKVLDTTHRRGERRGATDCDKCCDKECKKVCADFETRKFHCFAAKVFRGWFLFSKLL